MAAKKTTSKKATAPKKASAKKTPAEAPEQQDAAPAVVPSRRGKGSKLETGAETAAEPRKAKAKKLSAIDAAAQVLAASKEPMTCGDLIEAMAVQKLWTSPGGKTPAATLYSAILREIAKKGKDSRFKKADRGLFAANK